MELKSLFTPLWKWRWIILSAAIIAGLVSFIVSLQQAPQYQSRTTLLLGQSITNPNPNTSQFFLEQQLAAIYADMGTRDPVRRGTMAALGLDWLPPYVVRVIPDTQLIEISVSDTDPYRAKAVAAEIANQLILKAPTTIDSDQQDRQNFIIDQLSTLEKDIETTQNDIEQKKLELGTLNSASQISSTEQQIFALENKLSTLQDTYASLLTSTSKGALNSLTIIEPAELPIKPISPSILVTTGLAMLVGFFLAAIGVYLLELLDQTVNTPEEAAKSLGTTLLGEIPKIDKDENRLSYVNDQPFSPITDAFRSLRNNLEFINLGKEIKTLLITSSGVNEGKSTVAMNLALSLAKSNKRVIIIDADFYQSTIKDQFKLKTESGLGDFLQSGKNSISEHLVSIFNGQLYLLPAGRTPANPSELLSSRSTEKVLETLKSVADVVIIDGPPFITSDAIVLASKSDGVLVVVNPGRSRRDVLKNAREQLDRASANLIGFVINGSKKRSAYYNYYNQPRKSVNEKKIPKPNLVPQKAKVIDKSKRTSP